MLADWDSRSDVLPEISSVGWSLEPDASVCCASGTDSRHTRPSERQSNKACPPSCDSILFIRLLVPKPRISGFWTKGPPVSSHDKTRLSDWPCHMTDNCPDKVERAPYFAELVTSSCKAKASV